MTRKISLIIFRYIETFEFTQSLFPSPYMIVLSMSLTFVNSIFILRCFSDDLAHLRFYLIPSLIHI